MEASFQYCGFSFILFLLSLFPHRPLCQQSYVGHETCSVNDASAIRGYTCDASVVSCKSHLTFRSRPPYDTRPKIAGLLGSYPYRNYSQDDPFSMDEMPIDGSVSVPVSCSCWGKSFKYKTDYIIARGDSYDKIANDIFQGLTSCAALRFENDDYAINNISSVGRRLQVPLRCACPTKTQKRDGIISLLVYMVNQDDDIASIAEEYGVDAESVLQANELSNASHIHPFTPILVPLKNETCKVKPAFDFCLQDRDLHHTKFFPEYDATTDLPTFVSAIGVGSGIGLLILVLVGYRVYQVLKKRRHKHNRKKFFKQNGGSLLQQKLHKNGEKVKIFSEEEIERATENYSPSRFLGQGGYGTVYKGMLKDGTTVAIKRSKQIETNWIEQFINEVVVLSQINHRNVVKLLGCCLETEFPVLVYEFVSNGTLAHHIHEQDSRESPSLSWETRLRIASEVAGAISYMHSAASIPIFHRDIKSLNILLDNNYNAKVSDFGTSRFVPCDQSHLTTKVQGTLGYIDPEYFRSSQYTEKSDVYSFGVLMVELLTGKTPFTFAKEEGENLLDYFIALEHDNQFVEIVDITVGKEASIESIQSFAKLAIKCLRLNGKRRPPMKQVFLEIEGLRQSQDRPEIVEESQSTRISSMHSASNSHGELTDESIISIEMETL